MYRQTRIQGTGDTRTADNGPAALIANGFAGAAFVVAPLEPAVSEQDGFDTSNHHGLGWFNVVSSLLEQDDGVRGNAALYVKSIWLRLMMDAGEVDGVLDVHAEIDDIEYHLQDSGDDAGAAGGTQDQERLAVFQHDGGDHGRKRSSARGNGVGFTLNEAEKIRRAGPGGEIVHFVVEEEAGAGNGDAAAVACVQGVSDGDDVPLFIGNTVVRGFGAFRNPGS